MAGIPDHDADKESGKRTLAVRLGRKGAARMAIVFSILAAMAVIGLSLTGSMHAAFRYLVIPVIPHAAYLCYRLIRYLRDPDPPHRIDGLMVLALTYILWFGLIPLVNLG
jgi:4-hydroxybenzoate polyprenyltransferase